MSYLWQIALYSSVTLSPGATKQQENKTKREKYLSASYLYVLISDNVFLRVNKFTVPHVKMTMHKQASS